MAPSNKAAWIMNPKEAPLVVKEAPYPSIGDDEILLKNHAIAINPVEWKVQLWAFIPVTYPHILGSDVAGEVVEVGAGVKNFARGDRAIGHGLSLSTSKNEKGAFQQYTVLTADMAAKIPSSLDFTQASVLPLAISTAAAGLFTKDFLALDLPTTPDAKSNGQTVLIWGGSSSVGAVAIQLTRAAGYEVITTASSRNHAFCKSLGASEVFDHTSPTVLEDILSALANKKLVGVYDAISDAKSQPLVSKIAEKFNVFLALSLPADEKLVSKQVKSSQFFAPSIRGGPVGNHIWGKYIPEALENGDFKAAPAAKVIGNGLEHIQAAMDANQAGLSAQKAVVTLD